MGNLRITLCASPNLKKIRPCIFSMVFLLVNMILRISTDIFPQHPHSTGVCNEECLNAVTCPVHKVK